MKKLLLFSLIVITVFVSCDVSTGELTGVDDRELWYEADPHGMMYIKMGSYTMGPNDQDVTWAMTAQSKVVSVPAFWMDETEITNNEYRQFVYWVRDSLAYLLLGEDDEDTYLVTVDDYGEDIDPPFINWDAKIDWRGENEREILNELYLPEHERFYRRKEIDTRKLNFEYQWIDLKQAAKKYTFDDNKTRSYHTFDVERTVSNNGSKTIKVTNERYDGEVNNEEGQRVDVKSRASFIMKDIINVYPDTLCWIRDFTYSYNDPLAQKYFWHPAYDNYPVVGVSWKQAVAFGHWRTQLLNGYLAYNGETFVQDFRLPKESEWEYAARGDLDVSMYPWGGYYTRNNTGCFLANFKPLRGDYRADGGLYTVIVAHYEPNDYGLYDMAGNVAEWTGNAFNPSAYSYTDDLVPDYTYDALPDELPEQKRKVIRGGSWKDIGYYMQCGTRTYEYQDTAKSYIGFRMVRSYLGRDNEDGVESSKVY